MAFKRYCGLRFLCVVTLLMFMAGGALAEEMAATSGLTPDSPFAAPRLDEWKVIGPGGGGGQFNPTISPIDPNVVLINCDMTGAYITKDGGQTWRMFNGRTVSRFFVLDPNDINIMYSNRVGLMRSADGGQTWDLVFPNADNFKQLVISDDHAGEWIVTKDGSRTSISTLAVDPSDSKTLYAVMTDAGQTALRISRDWGKTWDKEEVLPAGGQKIYIDPKSLPTDRTIYIVGAASVSVRERGKWRHQNGPEGVTRFGTVSGGFGEDGKLLVYGVAARGWRRETGGKMGIFVTTNGGASWKDVTSAFMSNAAQGAQLPSMNAIATCQTNPKVAYLSYQDLNVGPANGGMVLGVAKTANGGASWELVWKDTEEKAGSMVKTAWLTDEYGPGWGESPFNLCVAPTDAEICYGTDFGRTVRTTDGGKTWVEIYSKRASNGAWSTTGLDVTTCYGVHFDPFDPKHIFISYTDIGLFYSEDFGTTWLMPAGIPRGWRNTTYWMQMDPEVKGRMWATMSSVHDLPRPKMWRRGMGHRGGVTVSDDAGATWRASSEGMPETNATHIILDPGSPAGARVLYVAGFGTGVWKSADDGKTWTLKNRGIPGEEPFAWRLAQNSKGRLYLIVARKTEEGEIGDAGDGALYTSNNAAESWSKITLPAGCNGPNGLFIDPKDDNRLLLAAWGRSLPEGGAYGGIFLSTDAGKSWKHVLSEDQYIYDVTGDARDANVLYACGFGSSVWRSEDRGETWNRIKGFNFKWGHRVISDPYNADKIFVSTFGGSVWYGPAKGDPKSLEDIPSGPLAFTK